MFNTAISRYSSVMAMEENPGPKVEKVYGFRIEKALAKWTKLILCMQLYASSLRI